MNHYDTLKNMNCDKFAEWLDTYINGENTPWDNWFEKKYCNNCQPIQKNNHTYAPCELGENRCGFVDCDTIDVVKAWLLTEDE